MFKRESGTSLIELTVVIAIIGILALCAIPSFGNYRRNSSVISAGNEMRGLLRSVRSRAITRGRNCGVKFTRSGSNWTYTLYDDGNNNGIYNADINKGIDRRYFGPAVVMPSFRTVSISLLRDPIRDPDGAKLLPTDPALQFGNSTICSFSAVGASTPGTMYISDGIDHLYAVRVFGASGKVRMLRYDAGRRKWEER